jgi:hypothetical protein
MMADHAKLVELIAACSDPVKLRNWIANARREGAKVVEDAAVRRLITLGAKKYVETNDDKLVLDFWKSIIALEFALTDERGKTTRLARTRQKIGRVGVKKTLVDLTMSSKPSEGYFLLRDRNMLEMSAEAVVLRHTSLFADNVVQAATKRMVEDQCQSDN